MILLTTKEAAAFLRYKNYMSLYNNKTIPRHSKDGRVWYVKEELEQWVLGKSGATSVSVPATNQRNYRIKVRP
jgi:hypothetical protein